MSKTSTRIAVCALLLVFMIVFFPERQTTDIYSEVVRFHVLANSDSDYDQAVKLAVKDALVTYAGEREFDSIETAVECFSSSLDTMKEIADGVLEAQNADYTSRVTLTREVYDRRDYDSFSLPYGEYLSLKVELGEGMGKNWWCVLFPPVCLDASTFEDEMIAVGLTENQVKVMKNTGKPKIRFFIADLFERICKG